MSNFDTNAAMARVYYRELVAEATRARLVDEARASHAPRPHGFPAALIRLVSRPQRPRVPPRSTAEISA